MSVMSPVFEEPTDPWGGPLGWSQPEVDWYLRSTQPEAVDARASVNEMYRSFPDESGEMRRRLHSRSNTNHFTALDELFAHSRINKKYAVIHEEGGKGPDFRLYIDEEYFAAIEVVSLFMRGDWRAEQQRHGQLIDEVNARVPLTSHLVRIEILRYDQMPRVRELADWLKVQIGRLQSGHDLESRDKRGLPVQHFVRNAAELRCTFLPVRPNIVRGPHDRVVGMGDIMGGFVNSSLRLRESLESKDGSRYELRDRPFALFVGVHDPFCTLDQIEDAVFGGQQVVIGTGEVRRTEVSRADDGFFGPTTGSGERVGKQRRVSTIFTPGRRWGPGIGDPPTMLRVDNPFAASQFPDDVFWADFRWGVTRRELGRLWADWQPYRP
jgi:hypothetical protein